jgi:hypothetical protein
MAYWPTSALSAHSLCKANVRLVLLIKFKIHGEALFVVNAELIGYFCQMKKVLVIIVKSEGGSSTQGHTFFEIWIRGFYMERGGNGFSNLFIVKQWY